MTTKHTWFLTGTLHSIEPERVESLQLRPSVARQNDGDYCTIYFLSRRPTHPHQVPFVVHQHETVKG